MSNENKLKFMESSNTHITNLNRALKNIKSEVMADFVCIDQAGITIRINKDTLPLNLQMTEKYVKDTNLIDLAEVNIPCLPQLKLYLKIIGISYLL